MTLLIDNYDSFSFNLYQMVGTLDPNITVIRNDQYTIQEIEQLHPDRILLSPGPGKPSDAGICEDVVLHFQGKIPILGVCLGHQAICEAYHAVICHAKQLMHGKQSVVTLDTDCALFKGMDSVQSIARYHSLAVKADTLPDFLKVTAMTKDHEIMAVAHKEYPIFGLQFHPESILTPQGSAMLNNFMKISC